MRLTPDGLPGQVETRIAEGSNQIGWKWLSEIAAMEDDSVLGVANIAAILGAINAATGLSAVVERQGTGLFKITFTLAAVSITVTDAAGSGSSGSLKIWDFPDGKQVIPIACFQNYTAFAEGAALTGAAGDAAFVMGLGSAAANAGDAALTGTEVDLGAVTGTITLSSGTGTGKKSSGAGLNSAAGLDGSSTGIDLYLNWSGSAATIDANSTISVTGTIALVVQVF